jgi:hypothetical protein
MGFQVSGYSREFLGKANGVSGVRCQVSEEQGENSVGEKSPGRHLCPIRFQIKPSGLDFIILTPET